MRRFPKDFVLPKEITLNSCKKFKLEEYRLTSEIPNRSKLVINAQKHGDTNYNHVCEIIVYKNCTWLINIIEKIKEYEIKNNIIIFVNIEGFSILNMDYNQIIFIVRSTYEKPILNVPYINDQNRFYFVMIHFFRFLYQNNFLFDLEKFKKYIVIGNNGYILISGIDHIRNVSPSKTSIISNSIENITVLYYLMSKLLKGDKNYYLIAFVGIVSRFREIHENDFISLLELCKYRNFPFYFPINSFIIPSIG